MKSEKVRLLLTLGTCVGIAGTGVAAGIGGMKARDAMYEDPSLWGLDSKMKAKMLWKYYAPAAGIGAATIGCTIASHKVNGKLLAGMAGLAVSSQRLYKRYESKIKEFVPKEKLEEVKKEIFKEQAEITRSNLDRNARLREKIQMRDKQKYYEVYTNQFFFSTPKQVDAGIDNLNNNLANGKGETLNEYLKDIGAKEVTYGDDLGWYTSTEYWNWIWDDIPGVEVVAHQISDKAGDYTALEIVTVPPDLEYSDPSKYYMHEIEDAKMRWENEYA